MHRLRYSALVRVGCGPASHSREWRPHPTFLPLLSIAGILLILRVLLKEDRWEAEDVLVPFMETGRPQYCESCRFERSLGTIRSLKQPLARPQSIRRLSWRALGKITRPLDHRSRQATRSLSLEARAQCADRPRWQTTPYRCTEVGVPASHQEHDETLSYPSGTGLDLTSPRSLEVNL